MPAGTPGAPTRRAVLSGAALLASAAACRPFGRSAPAPTPDPDAAALATAVDSEHALMAAYDAAIAGQPELAARLLPLREHHRVHLQALTAASGPPTVTPSATAAATTATTTTSSGADALAVLEKRAAARLRELCAGAHRAELAPLLASIGAAEAGHVVVLAGHA